MPPCLGLEVRSSGRLCRWREPLAFFVLPLGLRSLLPEPSRLPSSPKPCVGLLDLRPLVKPVLEVQYQSLYPTLARPLLARNASSLFLSSFAIALVYFVSSGCPLIPILGGLLFPKGLLYSLGGRLFSSSEPKYQSSNIAIIDQRPRKANDLVSKEKRFVILLAVPPVTSRIRVPSKPSKPDTSLNLDCHRASWRISDKEVVLPASLRVEPVFFN